MSRDIAVTASGGGAVAAGSAATCEAAAQMLRLGGTAIDAAVAGAFAATMAEPTLASLGGGGFCLVAAPDEPARVIDFFVNMPGLARQGRLSRPAGPGSSIPDPVPMDNLSVTFGSGVQQEFHVGWASVAVPGTLFGLIHLHRCDGRLPLADVIAPALAAARDGIILEPVQVEFIRVIGPILTLTSASATLFTPPLSGEPFRNPAYADMLERLAGGESPEQAFAIPVADEVARHRGLVTLADMSSYDVIERAPVGSRRGDTWIWSNPPPAFGGAIVLESLGLVPRSDPWPEVPRALRAATQRHRVQDADHARVRRGTTHLTVIDADGRIAALSLSNGSGSGTVAAGVPLNNMLGEADLHPGGFHSLPAGARLSSMMAPTLAIRDDGSIVALGTGGSERIRSALVEVLVRHLDIGEDLADAVAAPRLHVGDDVIDIEPGFPEGYVAALRDEPSSPPCRVWPGTDLYFGGVHAVARENSGRVTAVADARRGGAVAVID